jgi:hypothetical protein
MLGYSRDALVADGAPCAQDPASRAQCRAAEPAKQAAGSVRCSSRNFHEVVRFPGWRRSLGDKASSDETRHARVREHPEEGEA